MNAPDRRLKQCKRSLHDGRHPHMGLRGFTEEDSHIIRVGQGQETTLLNSRR